MAKRKSSPKGKGKTPRGKAPKAKTARAKGARRKAAAKAGKHWMPPPALRPRKARVRRILAGAPRPAPARKALAAASPYARDLDRCAANYQPLTPLTFLERAAS